MRALTASDFAKRGHQVLIYNSRSEGEGERERKTEEVSAAAVVGSGVDGRKRRERGERRERRERGR